MPQVSQLVNYHMQAVKGSELDEGDNGSPGMVDVWMLVFTDRGSQDQIRISFRKDARDEIVRQLTGGVILAGGDLPQM
jgi:hypothetical protein